MKLLHVQSKELLNCMCKEVSSLRQFNLNDDQMTEYHRVKDAIFRSIEKGNFDFIFGMVKANPNLKWSHGVDRTSIFSFAVLHRQPKIFSLIYGLPIKKTMITWFDEKGNTMLHMAGMIGASIQINRIPGAALQMQRELQWFKVISLI
jgi:hypothetical protein